MLTVEEKKNKWLMTAFCAAVFVCMFVFFYAMHPLVILDSDDWKYVSFARPALPSPTFWNPGRILPELLMPGCGAVALAIYRMGLMGYIESQILVFAITAAAFITAYTGMFARMLRKKSGLPLPQTLFVAALFLVLHFLIFRTEDSGNYHLFWSYDATCFFYYTIPAILNCTLVMYFMSSDILETFLSPDRILWKAVLVVIVYLAVFSNLFESVILAVYVSVMILKSLIRKEKQCPAAYAIVVLWIVSALFEMSGSRAAANDGVAFDIRGAAVNLGSDFGAISIWMICIMLVCAVSAFILNIVLKKGDREFIEFLRVTVFSGIILCLAEVLLCAKVSSAYMLRPQVFFGIAFSLIAAFLACGAYSVKHCSRLFLAVPLLLLVAVTLSNTQEITYAENNTMNLPWKKCVEIDNDIISQAQEADAAGLDSFELEMMDTGWDDNWPHTSYMANNTFKQTLIKHALISRDMEIIPVWSKEFNQRHGIEISFYSEWRHY